ncbi:DUF3836 domain-containing protein [Dysgonomonas sp. 521]|uniref:DUF3836 domain-containing protein n=1 Tax=Dysgonomonas sp. 521 TaxID=2302932 RepID=UPI001C86D73E|nr:DUF3836 domain-containing protein [Dysgonomonas sp. 521]
MLLFPLIAVQAQGIYSLKELYYFSPYTETMLFDPHYDSKNKIEYYSIEDYMRIYYEYNEEGQIEKKTTYLWDEDWHRANWDKYKETTYTYQDGRIAEERTKLVTYEYQWGIPITPQTTETRRYTLSADKKTETVDVINYDPEKKTADTTLLIRTLDNNLDITHIEAFKIKNKKKELTGSFSPKYTVRYDNKGRIIKQLLDVDGGTFLEGTFSYQKNGYTTISKKFNRVLLGYLPRDNFEYTVSRPNANNEEYIILTAISNGKYVNHEKITLTYKAPLLVSSKTRDYTFNDKYISSEKTENTFDSKGQLTKSILYDLNKETKEWEKEQKHIYEYDNNGFISLHEEYMMRDNTWQGEEKYKWAFTPSGELTYHEKSEWKAGKWVYEDKIEKSYTISGKLSSKAEYRWYGEKWEPYERTDYTYDNTDRILTETLYKEDLSVWKPSYMKVYGYTPTKYSITEKWWRDDEWQTIREIIKTCDGKQSIESEIIHGYEISRKNGIEIKTPVSREIRRTIKYVQPSSYYDSLRIKDLEKVKTMY